MAKKGTLLIVDDNQNILTSLKYLMGDYFRQVLTLDSPKTLPSVLLQAKPDVVLLDMNFNAGMNSGNEGLYWLREIKRIRPTTNVVLFTAYADIQLAVTGIKEGACDFIVKPWDNKHLITTLQEAYTGQKASQDQASRYNQNPMYWGESAAIAPLRMLVNKVSSTDANILITGENGTGKDMLAREIHRLSARATGPLVIVDMGAITETLFESELFGHVKGSFTDAHTDRIGRFEAAQNGTLFLDEIANLPFHLQAKLLTALQQRTIIKVGSNQPIKTDIRLICATNRNLQQMVANGEFREDLLYRINTIHLHIPALRERKEDILPFSRMFLTKYNEQYHRNIKGFTPEAENKLLSHSWSGNIRELQHCIEKAVILNEDELIHPEELQVVNVNPQYESTPIVASPVQTLDSMEKSLIRQAIEQSNGNLSLAAAKLGITRQTLYNKMKRYEL